MSKAVSTPRDQPTRDRVVSDFGRNFLVEAGAGSGKTHSLAMRMAAGIEHGAFEVSGMAAVTFTRKAAAELRGRFQEALEDRLRRAPGGDGQRRLREALEGIEHLFAGTIHAFCAHLLRERPVDAQVAPGFDELGDTDNALLRQQAWRDFVVERRAAGWQPLLDLLEAGVRPWELDAGVAAVCEHEDVEFDRGSGTAPEAAPVWSDVDRFWACLKALAPPEFPEKTTCPLQQRFDEYDGRIRLARRDRVASLAAFCNAWKGEVRQKHWAGRGKEVKALVDTFTEATVEPFLEAWRAYVHHLSMRVLVEARDACAGVRRRRNAVNYVDLLRVTARMLRERGAVRRALQAKYRWLFIDEFQDTDPIQAEIFLMLAAAEPEPPGGAGGDAIVDPFTLPLRPGSLFVVGDPKQSIFRFRRADIDIYNRVGDRIEQTGGERLSLTANFRSLPGVCALANQVFPPLFGTLSLPWSPPFEPLDPVRPETGGDPGPRIVKLTLPEAPKAAEATRREASAIAGYIKGEVASGRRKAGDFLVLTRFRTRLADYVSALDALDVPVEVSGAGFFCKSPDVQAVALLLAALADPLDAVALVGVLRGPLFGISDPELFRFTQAGGRLELHGVLTAAGDERELAALDERFGPALAAIRQLQAFQKLTWSLPLGAALDAVLEQTGWLALASTGAGGAPAGHLLQAIDRVRQVVEAGGGLAAAAEALQEGEESSEADALPLEPGRRDVVRLMNLHKAKGLEAPVVILADAAHDFRFPVDLRIRRDPRGRASGYLCLSHKRNQGFGDIIVGKPRDWASHEAEESKYLEAERLRLLYVAATRAEDLLIVCRSEAQKSNKAWREFEGFLEKVPDLELAETDSAPTPPEGDVSPKARVAARRAREGAHAEARRASWAIARVTGTLGPREEGARPSVDRETQVAGPLWGTLIHGLLEHAVRHGGAPRRDLERLARWLTVESPDLRPYLGAAVDLVESVRNASFWKEVGQASEAHVEVPFAFRVEAGQSPKGGAAVELPTVVRGVIDLAYRSGTGWRVLDYKTDRAPGDADAVRARHGAQVRQYATAWEHASGEAVEGAGIVLVRSHQVVEA